MDEAIVVAESLNDFPEDAKKGRDNRRKASPRKVDNNRNKDRAIQNRGSDMRGNTIINPLFSAKTMRIARKSLLIMMVVIFAVKRHMMLITVHPLVN